MDQESSLRSFRIRSLLACVIAVALCLAAGGALAAGPPVDINKADQKALEALPGVGPATAKEIIKARPYKSVDDLADVKGVGKAKLEKLRPLVTVGGPAAAPAPAPAPAAKTAAPAPAPAPAAKTAAPANKPGKAAVAPLPSGPVNINSASREQLEALPGIGSKKAQAIIDGRPYAKPEDIMKVKGIKQGTYDKIKDQITVR